MAKMCDIMCKLGVTPPAWVRGEYTPRRLTTENDLLKANLRAAQIFDCANVTDYFYGGTTQEHWEISRDFPNVAPPFPLFWMETRRPLRILSEVNGEVDPKTWPEKWGVLFTGTSTQEMRQKMLHNLQTSERFRLQSLFHMKRCLTLGEKQGLVEQLHKAREEHGDNVREHLSNVQIRYLNQMLAYHEAVKGNYELMLPRADSKWVLSGELYVHNGVNVSGPVCMWTIHVGANGQAFHGQEFKIVSGRTPPKLPAGTEEQFHSLIFPFLMALSFIHCRNTTIQEHGPDAGMVKAFTQKRRHVPFRYHTINIDGMRRVLHTEGQAGTTGIQKALHICRGHFATYTEDAPLFGRIVGTVWKPQHYRGSITEGQVTHDYRVKPGPAAPAPQP